MMNTSKKPAFNVPIGTIITGKWHRKRYTILKSLGYGATGIVYLAKGANGLVALKISDDSMAITSEVNVLRHFSKVQGCLGPSLLDVDDWIRQGIRKPTPFYVMEFLNGTDFLKYIEKNGIEWLGVLILQLLSDLERLHEAGWVFGDLKPDNLLVVGPRPRVRWLDVGGTTIKGRSIKEFTEFFDRGYWGLGSRKAEPSYDLFAVAMIMINAAYPNRFSKKGEVGQSHSNYSQLVKATHLNPLLKKYEKVIIKAIEGRYKSALEMRDDLINALQYRNQVKRSAPIYHWEQKVQSEPIATSKVKKARRIKKNDLKRKPYRGILETIILAIFLMVAYFLYIAGHSM